MTTISGSEISCMNSMQSSESCYTSHRMHEDDDITLTWTFNITSLRKYIILSAISSLAPKWEKSATLHGDGLSWSFEQTVLSPHSLENQARLSINIDTFLPCQFELNLTGDHSSSWVEVK